MSKRIVFLALVLAIGSVAAVGYSDCVAWDVCFACDFSTKLCRPAFSKGYCECTAGVSETGGRLCVASGGTCRVVKIF